MATSQGALAPASNTIRGKVTLKVGTKTGTGLMRRLDVSPDPVVMLDACLQEAAKAAGVQLQVTDTEILIAP